MSEKPETVHVVMRNRIGFKAAVPVKVADDREDARQYARRMRRTTKRYRYVVRPCPKL